MRKMLTNGRFVLVLVVLTAAGVLVARELAGQSRNSVQAPYFEVDPMWPKPLPNHWVLGMTIGVWRRRAATTSGSSIAASATLGNNEKARSSRIRRSASAAPARRRCSSSIRPATSSVTGAGPGEGYEWPAVESRHHVDHKGNVWIGGNGGNDAHVLKFTKERQVPDAGRQAAARKNKPAATTRENFGRVAKIFVDPKANEAYIADGYGNKRVAVIDADTGKFKRYWGAYGNKPDDTNLGRYNPTAPPAQQFRKPVHCAELLERRPGLRVRPAERSDPGVHEGRQVREGSVLSPRTPSATARCGTSRSRRIRSRSTSTWPTARNEKMRILDRETLEELTQLRRRRPPARSVLRRAQHRHRLEGQHLHDRDLRGQAPAEVRLQRARAVTKKDQGTVWPR